MGEGGSGGLKLGGATLVAALVAGAAWTGMGPSSPAGAAVTVTSAGTTVTVTSSAGSPVEVTCSGGQVRAQGIAPSPPVSCAAATRVTVVGDDANNYVNLQGLGSAFPALAEVLVSPGGGSNLILGSPQRDSVIGTMGGRDHVRLDATGDPDGPIDLGSGEADTVSIEGTSGNDTIVLRTGSPSSRVDIARGTWSVPVTGTRARSASWPATVTTSSMRRTWERAASPSSPRRVAGVTTSCGAER